MGMAPSHNYLKFVNVGLSFLLLSDESKLICETWVSENADKCAHENLFLQLPQSGL